MNNFVQMMVDFLLAQEPKGNMAMPGNPRYQPKELLPIIGYDNLAKWLVLVELAWIKCLHLIGYSKDDLSLDQAKNVLLHATTTQQDELEDGPAKRHDIVALRMMMGPLLPEKLHRLIHHSWTSYDAIDTARALMHWTAYDGLFRPQLEMLDEIWRQRITENIQTSQIGRTHLQHALPVTVGLWLAQIHGRFADSVRRLDVAAQELTGKISGAVGSYAAVEALGIERAYQNWRLQQAHDLPATLEQYFLNNFLGLPGQPRISTQIVQPEIFAHFAFQLVMVSAALAQLGEDSRILQMAEIDELRSVSSTSSTMAHKTSNPIAGENLAGMYTTVVAEFLKVEQNMVSDLQRDLRNSSPARDYPAILIYVFQQLKTASKLLSKLEVKPDNCARNFSLKEHMLMAELLYLLLARAGYDNAHSFVNEQVMPLVSPLHSMVMVVDELSLQDANLHRCWMMIAEVDKSILRHPDHYLGRAIAIALGQAQHPLF